MISVLLTILKIIGIILLSLLCLLLLVLLLVLFVPARYQLKGFYKDELQCKAKVTWLLHFITIYVDYNKEVNTTIRIMGISLSHFLKKKDGKGSAENDSSVNEADSQKNLTAPNQPQEGTNKHLADNKDYSEDNNKEKITPQTTTKNNTAAEKKGLWQKIVSFITDIKKKIAEILNRIKSIIQNIKTKKETLEYYISIIKSDEVKGAFSLCKKRIKKLFKHLLPKRMKVNTKIGFEDPSTTGYLLAGYSLLSPKFRKKIVIYPEFNEQILECDFYLKGYMNAWSLLYQILCVVLDKNCKSLFKIVKKEILDERK